MGASYTERLKTLSCGGLPWRVKDGALQVLLILQFSNSSSWGLPKGHTHPGEEPEQCALREIHEETGVMVTLGQRLPDLKSLFRNEDKTVMLWLATPVGDDEPKHDHPDNEVADARWFNVDALPQIHAYQRELVSSAVLTLKAHHVVSPCRP